MGKSKSGGEQYIPTVAPVESVDETPKQEISKAKSDPCWNCGEQLTDNKCISCGFDKSLLYNLDLEAQKAVVRQKQQLASK